MVGAYLRKNRTSDLSFSLFLGASAHRLLFVFLLLYVVCTRVLYFCAHMQTLAHICASRVARRTTKKAKNTFRINCRAGIPRRCTEQNAATLFVARKAGQDGKRRRTRVGWGRDGRFRRDAGGYGVSRKNANFSLQRRSRAREEPVVARSDVVASPAPRPKSWTWIVKTEKKEKDGGRRRAQAACERAGG